MIGVMAIDPGGTTGVAWGVFDEDECGESVTTLMLGLVSGDSCEVSGDEREQAVSLAQLWNEFYFECTVERGMRSDDVRLVVEDWTPRLPLKSGERVVFYPVRIPAMLEGLLGVKWFGAVWQSRGVEYQMPSLAMRFGTNARLRRWGRWVKGSDHRRDAWRHVGAYLSSELR